MPIVPAMPPQQLPSMGSFDYVTVDPVHRRMYAAHTFAGKLLVVDTDTGKLLGEVNVGDMHGVAYDTKLDTVFVAVGEDQHAISEVNPRTLKVTRTVQLPGHPDGMAYDPQLHRLYADEDEGTRIFVVDSKTFKNVGTIALPGHKPEYIAVDPKTHDVYQNIDDMSEVVVIDSRTLKITRSISTPELKENHPLQYDAAYDQIVVAGLNNKLSVYNSAGKHLSTVPFPTRLDQCDLDPTRNVVACGRGKITLLKLDPSGTPKLLGEIDVAPSMKTMAIDQKTGDIWVVWASKSGKKTSFYQRFSYKP